METKFQTSFIPKAPLSNGEGNAPKKSINFFVFISILIFILSLLAALGTYLYLGYLKKSEETIKINLDKNIKAFEPQTIETYVRLSSRLVAAHNILSKHVAISNVFDYLADTTLKTVRFTDFKYELGVDGAVSLSMNGQARNYNAVAYQSEVFGQKRDLRNLIFSNLDLDEKGNVIFKLASNLDPGFTYYSNTLNKRTTNIFSQDINESTDAEPVAPTVTPTSTTTPALSPKELVKPPVNNFPQPAGSPIKPNINQ